VWYSFTLADTRDEKEFMLSYREMLAGMGIDLELIPSGSENFWISAEPILFSISVNAVLFSIVLILVLLLVAFIYMKQRSKDIAILLALGGTKRNAALALISTALLIAVPSGVIGGAIGWFVALDRASSVISGMPAELLEYVNSNATVLIAPYWLVLQIALVVILLLVMTSIGTFFILRQPVLELLQNSSRRLV
jgi:ABC-type antimicrobial peptide transport system permease subunit